MRGYRRRRRSLMDDLFMQAMNDMMYDDESDYEESGYYVEPSGSGSRDIVAPEWKENMFKPGFHDRALKYKDVEGERTDAAVCGSVTPDYTDLTDKQLAYYLYWRSRILEGDCMKACEGFLNLFVCESVTLERDFDTILSALEAARYVDAFPSKVLDPLMFDLCMHYRKPVPGWVYDVDGDARKILVSYVLEAPFRFNEHLLDLLEDEEGEKVPEDDRVIYNKALNNGIKVLDEHVRKVTGRSLMERTCRRELLGYRPFGSLPLEGIEPVDTICFDMDVRFRMLVDELFVCCSRAVCGKGRASLKMKTKFRAIVEDAIRNPYSLGAWDVAEPPAVPSFPKGYVDRSCAVFSKAFHYGSSDLRESDLVKFRRMELREPCPYAPSSDYGDTYNSMSPQQFEYYIYWRTCAREGRYIMTDPLYIWLYFSELANTEPFDANYEKMKEMLEVYGFIDRTGVYDSSYDISSSLRRAVFATALIHGLEIPSSCICSNPILDAVSLVRFLRDGTYPPCEAMLLRIADLCSNTMVSVDDDVVDITNSILRRIDKDVKGGLLNRKTVEWKDIFYESRNGVPVVISFREGEEISNKYVKISMKRERYEGYNLCAECPDISSRSYFGQEFSVLLKGVIRQVRSYHGKPAKKEACKAFGITLDKVIEEEVQNHFHPSTRRKG